MEERKRGKEPVCSRGKILDTEEKRVVGIGKWRTYGIAEVLGSSELRNK